MGSCGCGFACVCCTGTPYTTHSQRHGLLLPRSLGPLLQAELDEEGRQVAERLGTWPLARLQSEGLVLLRLSGRWVPVCVALI